MDWITDGQSNKAHFLYPPFFFKKVGSKTCTKGNMGKGKKCKRKMPGVRTPILECREKKSADALTILYT